MTARRWVRILLGANAAALALLLAASATPVLNPRDYDAVPQASGEYEDKLDELDRLERAGMKRTVDNKRAIRTLRSAVVRRQVGGIGDYKLSGKGNGTASFVHEKTGERVFRSIGEELEGYVMRGFTETGVEFEKDGEIAEVSF